MQSAHGSELLESLFETEDAAFDAPGSGSVGTAEGIGIAVQSVFEG
jgi:hypothetical protein